MNVPERQRFTIVLPGQSVSTAHGFPLFVTLDEPVVSGFRLIGMFPTNWTHAPLGQSALVVQ